MALWVILLNRMKEVTKYQSHPDAKCKVTGMWVAFYDAYKDTEKASPAKLTPKNTAARILLIAETEKEIIDWISCV